jgi:hypothetical protein
MSSFFGNVCTMLLKRSQQLGTSSTTAELCLAT